MNRALARLGVDVTRPGAAGTLSAEQDESTFEETTMSYELAKVNGDDFEHAGDFETPHEAYAAALEFGPGEYAGTRDMDGGHYEEEIKVTEQNNVLVRNAGESEWSEWDG